MYSFYRRVTQAISVTWGGESMAGFIFTMNNQMALEDCMIRGFYSTNLSEPENNRWRIHHEGTFIDFMSMIPGDNVYFFIDRMIYGIGVLTDISGLDCKFENYPGATIPTVEDFNGLQQSMILNDRVGRVNNRCICFFKPDPGFFRFGVDIDDVLSSNPLSFRMLRALWKLSFVKVDDEENQAIKDILLKRNEKSIGINEELFVFDDILHRNAKEIISNEYLVTAKNIVKAAAIQDSIKHEMAIEAAIVERISSTNDSVFGKWDYVSHQVIASPFKPIDYIDKMDVFGYKYISGYNTISKYLIIEIKKDSAKTEVVDQVMKYVDWVNHEYAHDDYGMIEAFVVAYDFPNEVIHHRNSICSRNFIYGRRPAISKTWKSVRLIKYSYNQVTSEIDFSEI